MSQSFRHLKVRTETSPEDVGGMHSAEGILTARGGMTSHAAVVARGWGKCCISGCSDLTIIAADKVWWSFKVIFVARGKVAFHGIMIHIVAAS